MVIGQINKLIDAFFIEKGISSYKAAKDTGLSEPTINRYRKGESNPTDKNLLKLFKTYPDMEDYFVKESSISTVDEKKNQIPMYNFPAAASGVEIYNDPTADKVVGYMDIPGSHKESFALPCYGHSMYPTLANGDWAVVRPIHDTNEIVWGEVYYIEWGDYRMYKRLLKSDNEREVILWSDNQTDKIGDRPQYAEIVIQKKQIRKLCLLTEILKKPNY